MLPGAAQAARATRLATATSLAQSFGRSGNPTKSLEHLRHAIEARRDALQPPIPPKRLPPIACDLRLISDTATAAASTAAASSSGSGSASAPDAASTSSLPPRSHPSTLSASLSSSSPSALPLSASLSAPSPSSSIPSTSRLGADAVTPLDPPPRLSCRKGKGRADDVTILKPLERRRPGERDEAEEMLQRAVTGVIQAYNNSGRPHDATAFASRALHVPNFLPDSHPSLSAAAQEVADSLPPISVSTLHYKALLECAARDRSVQAARAILLHMLSMDLPVNGRIRRGLTRLIFSTVTDDSSHMLRMFRRILPRAQSRAKESGDDVQDRRLGKLAEFMDSLGLMDKVMLQKRAVFAKSSRSAEKAKQSPEQEASEAIRRWMVDDKTAPFETAPSQSQRLDTLEDLMDLSKPLAPSAYAMRMRVFAVLRKDFQSAQKLWRSMVDHGVAPNVKHLEPLVEGLLAVWRVRDAVKLNENAQAIYGIKPSLRIYTGLIRAHARLGDSQALKQTLTALVSDGHQIDETIVQIVDSARSRRSPSSVLERQVSPQNLHSVTSRFQVYMRAHDYLDAQQLLSTALDQGLRPDDLLVDIAKKSVNWLDKRLRKQRNGDPTAKEDDVEALEAAASLARNNLGRIRRTQKLTPLEQKRDMRRFRRGVVELILGLADGSLKRQAREGSSSVAQSANQHPRKSSKTTGRRPSPAKSHRTRTASAVNNATESKSEDAGPSVSTGGEAGSGSGSEGKERVESKCP